MTCDTLHVMGVTLGAQSAGRGLGEASCRLTQGWMERSSLRQPPLAHGGDVDTVLVTRHGIRPVPLDGGSPEHWEGKRDTCWGPSGPTLPSASSLDQDLVVSTQVW